jgi:hypothetical protein
MKKPKEAMKGTAMKQRFLIKKGFRSVIACAFSLLAMVLMILFTIKDAQAAKQPQISKAVWNAKKSSLTIQGKYWGNGQLVIVSNAGNGNVLNTVASNIKGNWTLLLVNPSSVPCRVRAESAQRIAEKDVKNASFVCNQAQVHFTEVFAFNDLGMHCYDKDFSVFAILPPFNVLHAQVVRRGFTGNAPAVLDDTQASVFYSAVADMNGSINTTSKNKTNFWDHVLPLFGLTLPVDTGLLGAKMPGPQNAPQAFSYDLQAMWFSAAGIPITNWDDNNQLNTYPLMGIQAFDTASVTPSPSTNVVVPASDEMHCSACHASNGQAADAATAARYGIAGWSTNPDSELQYRENILILHDGKHNGNLMNTKPVLCAACHYSPALDLQGTGPQGPQVGKPMLSHAIHSRHGKTLAKALPDLNNPPIIPDTGISTCYYCHPGNVTKCLRGAMGSAGIICQDCHGGLLAVGGVFPLAGNGIRTPWVNEPKCQSCHTGDAMDHLGNDIRLQKTYVPTDLAATPTLATNKRFAEGNDKLYRKSLGHGGMACEACHGSPHAEWPVGDTQANDNIAAVQLQGHTGPIIECKTCHADGPQLTTNGPHGLHNVNDQNWNKNHDNFYKQNPSNCKACHGLNLEGTVLSRAAANRSLISDDNKTISIAKGISIHCSLCHDNPLHGN